MDRGFLKEAMAEAEIIEAKATAAAAAAAASEGKEKGKTQKKGAEKTVRLAVVLDCVNYERNHFNYIEMRDAKYGSGGGVVSLSEEDEDEDAAGDGKKDMPQRRSGQTKEDEYDPDDDFIDDTVQHDSSEEKVATAHSGFFVNAGDLEIVEPELSNSSGSGSGSGKGKGRSNASIGSKRQSSGKNGQPKIKRKRSGATSSSSSSSSTGASSKRGGGGGGAKGKKASKSSK